MKKFYLLIILMLFTCACSNSNNTLSNHYYQNEQLIEIDNEKLVELEQNKESFAVFLYTPACLTSLDFKQVVEEFLKTNNLSFYAVSKAETDNTILSQTVKYYPSVVIYDEGKITKYLQADSDEDLKYYKTAENLKDWFLKDSNITLKKEESSSKLSNINRFSSLNDITFSEDKINIYVFWGNGCPHCEELFEFLEELTTKYTYFDIYAFEVWENEENGLLMDKFASALQDEVGRKVPYFIIGDQSFSGFNQAMQEQIETTITEKFNARYELQTFDFLNS